AERSLVGRLDDYPREVAFAAGGRYVVAVSSEIRVWEKETGKEVRRFASGDHEWFGALSADGQLVAMRSSDRETGGVILWETATGKQLCVMGDMHASDVILSPNSQSLVMAGEGSLQVWEVASARKVHESPLARRGQLHDIHIGGMTADGKKLLLHRDDHAEI